MFTHLKHATPAASYLVGLQRTRRALFTHHIGLYTVCLHMPDCNKRAAPLQRSTEEALTASSRRHATTGLSVMSIFLASPGRTE